MGILQNIQERKVCLKLCDLFQTFRDLREEEEEGRGRQGDKEESFMKKQQNVLFAKITNEKCSWCFFSFFKIQTALRHKSEIEHHRNKIRLRAKRKGHYEFPVVDDVVVVDSKEQHRIYRKAQMQIDKILDPGGSVPTVFIEPRKR